MIHLRRKLMSENKVCTVRDLLSGGDVRDIFRGI